MFIFFKYTILKCLYRASYALIRGAFHLCLKGRSGGKKTNAGGKKKYLRALSVSYNAGFFFTQPSDRWRREGWGTPVSAAPYWATQTYRSNHMEVTLAIKMCGSVCVCVGVSKEEWLRDIKTLGKKYIRAKSKRGEAVRRGRGTSVRVFSSHWANQNHNQNVHLPVLRNLWR